MSFPEVALAAGAELGKTAVNAFLTQRAAAYNQRVNESNMRRNFMYSQLAQQNAAANEAAGLKRAGLSPALANGAAAAPIAASSSGTAQPVHFDPANLLLLAQVKNVEADTNVKNTEAAANRQALGEKQTAGMTASLNLHMHFSNLAENTSDSSLKAFYQSMADEAKEAGRFALGAQDSLRNFQQLRAESFESAERIIKSRLSALIAEGQLNKALPHGDFFDKLVDLPQREYDKLLGEIAKLAAEKKNLEALEALATQQKSLTEEQQRQVEAMAKRLEDYNLPQLIKSGDSSGALAAFFGLLLEAIAGLGGKFSASSSTTTVTK